MQTIITKDSMTQAEILTNIQNYLSSTENYQSLNGTKGMDIVNELLAGWGAYLAYNNQTAREETYIETVKANQSISLKAIDYSYRVNRPSSPTLSITYTGLTPLSIKAGAVIGTYNDYNVVYTGKNRTLTSGSTLEARIGLLVEEEITIDKSKGIWTVDLSPTTFSSIENDIIYIKSGDNFLTVSRNLESMYLGNAVDYSIGTDKVRVFLYDNYLKKGSNVVSNSTVVVAYLEIDSNFNVNETDLSLTKNYILTSILSNGSRADDYLYVKTLLPFFNQTYRQAVSPIDFNYLCKPFQYFKDCSYVQDIGVPLKVRLVIKDLFEGQVYSFSLSSSVGDYVDSPLVENYEYTVKPNETYDTVVTAITDLIASSSSLMRVVYPNVGSIFYLEAYNASQEVQVTVYGDNNMTKNVMVVNRAPGQNLGYLYYTHSEISNGIRALTYYEQEAFVTYFSEFKIAGTTILIKPAEQAGFNFNLEVELLDNTYLDIFENILAGYIGVFNYSLNTSFYLAKALRDIAQFSYGGVKFVTAVNTSSLNDFTGLVDKYLFISVNKTISYKS